MNHALLAAAVSLTLAACGGNLHDIVNAHSGGEGTGRLYGVPKDKALTIARAVFLEAGADLDDHSSEGYVLAVITESLSPLRWGALCGAWVESEDPLHTRVTVITKRATPTFAKGLTEAKFHVEFEKRAAAAQ